MSEATGKSTEVRLTGRVRGNSVVLNQAAGADLQLKQLRGKEVQVTIHKLEDLKCVVFTHFMPGKRSVFVRRDVDKLSKAWQERFRRYHECADVVEKVFVFISEGYQALLAVKRQEAPFIGLEADRELIAIIRKAAEDAGCPKGFIVPIGFDQMVDVLSRLQRRATEAESRLSLLLLGSGEHMRYDSPKIVDAILRIAGRWTNRPVLRIDDDVEPDTESFKKLLNAYIHMPDSHPGAVFAFSGGYGQWDWDKQREQALTNNFAVRTFHLAKRTREGGLKLTTVDCKRFLKGLSSIGAEQGFDDHGDSASAQVISGAGFCLSYAAVKKLPPFANLDNPITWIDDHLKRKMHEGLDDLGENKAISRVVGALFRQNRGVFLSGEGAKGYLCTLARGCIFDGLVASRGGDPGLYTEAIGEYLKGRHALPKIFDEKRHEDGSRRVPRPLTSFGLELAEKGRERIEEIGAHWRKELSDGKLELDGSEFGPRRDFADLFLRPPVIRGKLIENAKECRVYEVLEDAEQYIDLLKVWRSFVDLLEQITDGKDWLFDQI